MRSPFVEFRAEIETLSNITINMNLTMIESLSAENPMDSEQAMKEYNSFYRAGTGAAKKNQSTDRYFEMENVYSNVKQLSFLKDQNQRQMPRVPTIPPTTTPKPAIVNIATKTQQPRRVEPEVKIIEVAHEQYSIKPLALQNMQPNEPKKSAIFQDSSTNIEDLKRHIVLLHNLTKQDKGFESKFVVFPNLKKDEPPATTSTSTAKPVTTTSKATTTARPVTTQEPISTTTEVPPTTTTLPPTTTESELPLSTSTSTLPNDVNLMDDMDMPPSERSPPALVFIKPTNTRNLSAVVDDEFFHRLEQVTSFPQVFLQNDQTPMVPTDETTTKRISQGGGGSKKQRRQNNGNNKKQQPKKGRKKDKNRMCKEVGNKFIGNCTFASNWNEKEEQQQQRNADQISSSLPVNGEYPDLAGREGRRSLPNYRFILSIQRSHCQWWMVSLCL